MVTVSHVTQHPTLTCDWWGQVKDGRGLRKFIKETLHATAGKISHELLGSVEIPMKNLPAR